MKRGLNVAVDLMGQRRVSEYRWEQINEEIIRACKIIIGIYIVWIQYVLETEREINRERERKRINSTGNIKEHI